LFPAIWNVFSLPSVQGPARRAATKTISLPALFANQMRTAPPAKAQCR
jgi:hypothetical protein